MATRTLSPHGRLRIVTPNPPSRRSGASRKSPSSRGNRLVMLGLYLAFALGAGFFLLLVYAVLTG